MADLSQADFFAIQGGGAKIDSPEGRRLLRLYLDPAHYFAPMKMYHQEAEQVRIAVDMVEVADRWFRGSNIIPPWDVPGWRERLHSNEEK